MDEGGQGSPPPYEYPEAVPEHVAKVDQIGNITTYGGTQYISNYTNVGSTATQHINEEAEVDRLRQQLRELQAREQAYAAQAREAAYGVHIRHSIPTPDELIDRLAPGRNERSGAANQGRHSTALRAVSFCFKLFFYRASLMAFTVFALLGFLPSCLYHLQKFLLT